MSSWVWTRRTLAPLTGGLPARWMGLATASHRLSSGDPPGQRAVFMALRLEAMPGRWEVMELLY